MTPEHTSSFEGLFENIYKGNKEAIKLSFSLLKCAHAWDDQYDDGLEIQDEVLFSMLFDIGGSYLWTPEMAIHFKSVYIRWQAANALEQAKEGLDKAWYLRASLYDLFVMIAERLYGIEWATTIAPSVYLAYGESLDQFLEEMSNA